MSSSSSASSSSQESLGFPSTRFANRRVLRTADSVDELDALGFAGVPRRYARRADSSSSSSSSSSTSSFDQQVTSPPPPFPAPPAYVQFESPEHRDGSYAEHTASSDVIMTTNGDVIKAKFRYKMHKLRAGKNAEEWHVFLNRSLKPGEAPWAPLGSTLWKVPRYELEAGAGGDALPGFERRSSV